MRYRLGMVLSGGGARGIAHIGVLAALAERGIEAECLSGTSSGGIVGAFYAAGLPPEAALEFFRVKSPFRLSKLSVGKPGILDAGKVRGDLLEYFPEDSFEALERPLFLTATDLLSGRPVVFHSGPLVDAILASSSVPMVFTPIEIAHRWYADGGIVNNFPVEPLRGRCDVLVGSYASPLRKVGEKDLDSALEISERALSIGIYFASQAKFGECDVLLSPPRLSRFGTFDTRHMDDIYDLGYRAALERLDDIEAALAAV